MRRLADHLQVDPMSIYNYVDGKEALLDGLVEALGNELQLPEDETTWKESLQALGGSLRHLAHDHPHAYGLLLGRGIMPESALRAVDTALASLESAGLDREHAMEMVRTLVAYAAGYAMLELSCPAPAGVSELEQLVMLSRALPSDAPARLVEGRPAHGDLQHGLPVRTRPRPHPHPHRSRSTALGTGRPHRWPIRASSRQATPEATAKTASAPSR